MQPIIDFSNDRILLILMFFLHWLFDFVLQLDGDRKHKSNAILIYHTTFYSMMMTVMYVILTDMLRLPMNPYFLPITWVSHTITDYITSRWNAKTYERLGVSKKWINQIGFDQWLHHAQLFLTI